MQRKPAGLEASLGQRVSITGVAHNAKAGAVVLTDRDEVVYLQGTTQWEEKLVGKRVVKTGVLRRERVYPDVKTEDGATSQGIPGEQFLLENVV